MSIYSAGMTGTQFLAALNKNTPSLYNVESYGAVHDGVTDDTVAIQTAINAACAGGGGVVYFPISIYIIAGALQNNIGGVNYKSQLYIPQVNYTDTSRISIILKGETFPNFTPSGYSSSFDPPITGTILRSTLESATALSYVIASIGAADNYDSKNYNQCSISDMTIQVKSNASSQITLGGIGFNNVGNTILRNISVHSYNVSLFDSAAAINNAVGIAVAKVNSEHVNFIENITVQGFDSGFLLGDHSFLNNLAAFGCKYGYNFNTNYQIVYGSRILSVACINSLYFSGVSYVKINELQDEWYDNGKWYDSTYTILDASNNGHGEIHYSIVEAGVGFNNAKFSKSGGANIQCFPIAFAAATSFTVTGARNTPEAALKNLITALAAKGIIIDSTTET